MSLCALNEYTSVFNSNIAQINSSVSTKSREFPLDLILSVPKKRRNGLFLAKNNKLCKLLNDFPVLYHPYIAVRVLQCTPVQLQLLTFIFIPQSGEDMQPRPPPSTSTSSSTSKLVKKEDENTSQLRLIKQEHVVKLLNLPDKIQSGIVREKFKLSMILNMLNHRNYDNSGKSSNPTESFRALLNQAMLEEYANSRGTIFENISHKMTTLPLGNHSRHPNRTTNNNNLTPAAQRTVPKSNTHSSAASSASNKLLANHRALAAAAATARMSKSSTTTTTDTTTTTATNGVEVPCIITDDDDVTLYTYVQPSPDAAALSIQQQQQQQQQQQHNEVAPLGVEGEEGVVNKTAKKNKVITTMNDYFCVTKKLKIS